MSPLECRKSFMPLAALFALLAASGVALSSPRPTVIELFTSQGCSSCPPADALLGELSRRPDVIALAFHVDYWDGLGWRDPFGFPEAAARQRRYVQALRLHTAFTPQIVIDGRHSLVGSNRSRVLAALGNRVEGIPIETGVANGNLQIAIEARDVRDRHEIVLVAYRPKAETRIPRGENAGRTLAEFNIVREHRVLGVWRGSAAEFTVPLSALPQDASAAAVLLQRAGQGEIAGATLVSLR